ncbi:AMP-binding protein [Pendulispora brunnea]|uniref:AMP-binding protein n=1 Tax=Pendulispora brunnea TaxID=2905690 RepID=A0ABZ2KL65_9BACT
MTREISTLGETLDGVLGDILQARARQQPEQTAYIYLRGGELDEIRVTYAELDRQARAVAATIQAQCRPGARVIMLYPPGLEFVAAFFGCLYAGVIAVPAYPPRANRNLSRVHAIVEDCQAEIALTTAQIGRSTRDRWQHSTELRWIATDALQENVESRWQKSVIDRQDIAFLQYTSGSTGNPKGVMVSHGNLIHNLQCSRDRCDYSPSSIGVSWLPQFHDLGLIGGILLPIYVGYKAVLLAPTAFIQKPYRWLHAISHYRGTVTYGPNFSFELCVQKITSEQRETLDLRCLENVINGAEPILVRTLESFSETFGPCGFEKRAFRGGYGLAEGTVFVTTGHRLPNGPNVRTIRKAALEQHRVEDAADQNEDVQHIVGCGPAAEDQKLAIVNPDHHVRCNPDQIGEIWVKGPSVAQGYWNRPEASTATFRAMLKDTNEGPFLRTGDLGFLHDDELFITGRMKDLIIVRGRNHYPQDIERTVGEAHQALRLTCTAAFSISENDEERVVVVQEIKRDREGVDLERVLADIFQSIAEEHELSVHAILLVEEGDISKTSSGKIQRSVCKQRYQDGSFRVVQQASYAGVEEMDAEHGTRPRAAEILPDLPKEDWPHAIQSAVAEIVATLTGRAAETLDPNAPLTRLGVDSLRGVQLKTMLEEEFDIAIRMANIFGSPTVRRLAAMLLTQITRESNARVSAQCQATLEAPTKSQDTTHEESRPNETLRKIERELAEIEAQDDD